MSTFPISRTSQLKTESQKELHGLTFVKEFLRKPLQVGSVIPSSEALSESMLEGLNPYAIETYIEYGPGTGAFTHDSYDKFPQIERSILFEINPHFQNLLKSTFPKAEVLNGPQELQLSADQQADLVISGLPFTNIPLEITLQTIADAHRLLKVGGSFRTFLYAHTFLLPKNRILRDRLLELFGNLKVRFVAANMPPAVVFECTKKA